MQIHRIHIANSLHSVRNIFTTTSFVGILGILLILPQLAHNQEIAQNTAVVSPELSDNNTVIFRINAPLAEAVKLTGNWMPSLPDGNGGFTQEMTSLEMGYGLLPSPLWSRSYTLMPLW